WPLIGTFTLNTGAKISAVGLGPGRQLLTRSRTLWRSRSRLGIDRHLDCAAIYRNETEVGHGIKKSGVDRKDIFITTKLWNTKHDPKDVEGALDQSLKDIGVDYVDLYLIHWPLQQHHRRTRWLMTQKFTRSQNR
ncbi:alcohol dehydrogenase, partial [Capronia coronata CBS 617.96]